MRLGSPPRMRGKQTATDYDPYLHGITPADAGKTHCTPRPTRSREDHPRGCGENAQIFRRVASGLGSPPRMRGKPFSINLANIIPRITPADAGKTCSFLFVECVYKDHPRGCGENFHRFLYADTDSGSPPRMRGKRMLQVCITL